MPSRRKRSDLRTGRNNRFCCMPEPAIVHICAEPVAPFPLPFIYEYVRVVDDGYGFSIMAARNVSFFETYLRWP